MRPMTLRRTIALLGSVSLAALAPALAATAAAAPRDSIKLVLPRQIHTGTRLTLVLTGQASGKKPEVWLYAQPQKCATTLTAEVKFRNLTIWISGGHVHGHYRYTDPVGFSQ